jgi:putative membrane protein insertion efficiency factor
MGHRHSPEEVGRAGRVCACDGGFVAAGAESVAVEQQIPHPQTARVRDDKSDTPSKSFGATGRRAALFALRFYKAYLSILFAGSCRFQPTCSQYSYEAIERFGVARGAWLTLKRLARCQPLSRRFGYDPVPEAWDKSEALAQDVRHSAATSHEVPT